MDKCNNDYSSEFKTKISATEYNIFIGAVDENGNFKEEPCNLDDEYKKCQIYLDNLNRMEKLIILFYTQGTLSTILSQYKNKTEILSLRTVIGESIIDFIKYRSKLDANINDYYKIYFITVIEWIKNKFVENINNIIQIINTGDPHEILGLSDFLTFENIEKLQKIIEDYNKLNEDEKIKIIMNDYIFSSRNIINYDIIIFNLELYVLDNEANIIEYIKKINEDINKIIDNSPLIEKCIRLYRAATYYENLKQDQEIIFDRFTSTSCSQKTNIAMFTFSNSDCCIVELIIKPGTHALFLNYKETAYGETMYEVLLQENLKFKVKKIEKKHIVKLLENKDLRNYIDNPDYEIKKIIDIKYNTPTIKSIKFVNIYLLEQIS